jgi:hypothetical protein
MKIRQMFLVICTSLLLPGVLLIAACSTPAAEYAAEASVEEMENVVEKSVEVQEAPAAEEAPAAPVAAEAETDAETVQTSYSGSEVNSPNRLIIKDGNMILLVSDTDQAIERITQMASDLGGYIISSRTWFQQNQGIDQKYGTMTLGVPVDEFEKALVRLRQIAVKVKDEQASGQDVSDEYTDLQSRLKNLEATRDRILLFMEDTKTVEEALKINEQLSEVESEIEQVKGRMNYLFDRASYSTITLQLEPEPPQLTPTLTPTPTITPTPTATATPTPWQPGETLKSATKSMGSIWRGVVEALIYFVTIVVPCLLPVAALIALIWWLRRRAKKRKAHSRENPPPAPEETPEA